MALGKRRRERQLEAFVVASDLPKSPGHPCYTALNRLPTQNAFDQLVESAKAHAEPARQEAVATAQRTDGEILRSCLQHRRGKTNVAARTDKRHEVAPDDVGGAASLDDHASDIRNRWSAGHGEAPGTSANRLVPLLALDRLVAVLIALTA